MEIRINRMWTAPATSQYRATTTGSVSINGGWTAFSLEPTVLMIPPGSYPVRLLPSARFKRDTPWLTVPGREDIEIHGVNTAADSEGCIGVAEYRLSDYEVYSSPPATTAIEDALWKAEEAGETNTVTITDESLQS